MSRLQRRTVLATGAALAVGGTLATVGADEDAEGTETDDDRVRATVEREGWTSARGNAANAAYAAVDEFGEPDAVAWTHDATGDLAVTGEYAYLRTATDVRALEVADGDLAWSQEQPDGLAAFDPTGTPAVADGRVYVAGGRLVALDATDGSLEWSASLGGGTTSPTVAYGRVYVVADGTLSAFDAAEGSLEWELETVEVATEDGASDDPGTAAIHEFQQEAVAVVDERVYALTAGEGTEAVVALDARSGEIRWTGADEEATYAGPITATPDRVFARTDVPDLRIEPGDGRRTVVGIAEGVDSASDGDATITGDRHSLDGGDWLRKQDWPEPYGDPLIVDDTVVVYSTHPEEDDAIVGFDVDDGTLEWELFDHTVDDAGISRTYVAGENALYVQEDDRLVALRAEPGDGSDDEDDAGEEDADEEGKAEEEDEAVSEEDADEEGADEDHEDEAEDRLERVDDTDGADEAGNETDDTDAGNESDAGGRDDDGGRDIGRDDGDDRTDDVDPTGGDETDDESDDATPGFTTVAGLTGGALSLEWLRRRARTDESDA